MSEIVGYIYILTNPSIPNYVKIGYADDVKERVKTLNKSECLPFSFRIYATYAVPARLVDKSFHAIIDKLDPGLRAVELRDGKKRVREFYAISPEDAYDLLSFIAEIEGNQDRLKREALTDEDRQNEINNDDAIAARARLERRNAFTFSSADIPIGAEIQYIKDTHITAIVISDKKIRYEKQEYSLTGLAKRLTGRSSGIQGPLFFQYEGEELDARRRRIKEERDNISDE